ncbi:MAG: hypothetical protein IJ685_01375 [Selenomonadaceae bacterium]|nr:hypothetical protein [Selenomonadaceae bacterium]
MRRKLIAGAALIALLMNSPTVSAEDEDVVIFGGEFEDDKPAPKPVEKPEPIREIPPTVEKPEPQPEPINKPEPQPEPVNEPEPEPQPVNEPEPEPQPVTEPEPIVEPQVDENSEDDDLGDVLIFDDISRPNPEPQPVNEPKPQPIDEPKPQPIDEPKPQPIDEPLNNPQPEPVTEPQPVDEPIIEPQPVEKPTPRRRTGTSRQSDTSQKNLKTLNQRFIKLAVDETYTYYLDKTSVQWKKMPYSTSEYIADFWIRMIQRDSQNSDGDFYGEDDSSLEILSAREQGYRYRPEDEEILRQQSYVLEHYYLRPKTKQIQFLCELEVFGRPQNTINERDYDYRNWENLVPGSVESAIYYSVVKILDLTKDNPKGHMTVSDMLDEYLRISL